MKEFFTENWFVIAVLLVLFAFDIYLAVTKQWIKLREQAYALMLQAERIFSTGEGRKKFEAVFTTLYYDLIPAWLRLFISPDTIKEKLQEWYDLAKDYLDNGKIDNSKV
jgi:hypothetical protein